MNVNDIYTPLEEVVAELTKRRSDKDLVAKVRAFIGENNLPNDFFDTLHAISIEDVATPNLYCWTFIDKAQSVGLTPLHFEYHDDKFTTTNYDKASLGKLMFYHGLDDNGNMIKSIDRVIDLSGIEEGKKLSEITTVHNINLIDFHHDIFLQSFPKAKLFDGSDWFKAKGGSAQKYYKYVLAMTICNGVLFDNFLGYKYEKELVQNILFPAYAEVCEIFGLKPLIVSVAPTDEQLEKFWWAYPEFTKTKINKVIYKDL